MAEAPPQYAPPPPQPQYYPPPQAQPQYYPPPPPSQQVSVLSPSTWRWYLQIPFYIIVLGLIYLLIRYLYFFVLGVCPVCNKYRKKYFGRNVAEGEDCTFNNQCKGFSLFGKTHQCCKGKCTKSKKDADGVLGCP